MNVPLPSIALSALSALPATKASIGVVAEMGARAVQLDAARAGMRPRELDRSARRDLAASMRREELSFSGIDLWIPPHHFIDSGYADRAVAAVVGALQMAAEVAGLVDGTPTVSLTLPAELDAGVRSALDAAAAGEGATLADHAWPAVEAGAQSGLQPGLDPAAVILAGDDPVAAAGAHGGAVAAARVADLSARGPCVPGDRTGRLDLDGYLIALAVAGTVRFAIIDPRGLAEPEAAVRATLDRWPAGFSLPNG